jgi:hypothetical protein
MKYDSLKAAHPDLPYEELEEITIEAAESAKEMFGKMVEDGADPRAVREQIIHDLTEPTKPQ